MYIYTDDDLTRINRDYLGPKGRRIPWVASYRTYVVVGAIALFEFFAFMMLDIPFNKWTALLYFVCVTLTVPAVLRRMNGDVSLVAMFRQGWQEVAVPRADTRVEARTVQLKVQRFDYTAEPQPKWWQRLIMKAKAKKPDKKRPAKNSGRRKR